MRRTEDEARRLSDNSYEKLVGYYLNVQEKHPPMNFVPKDKEKPSGFYKKKREMKSVENNKKD